MSGVEIGIVWVVEGDYVEVGRGVGSGPEPELEALSF